jgi:putative spermidine/putrescine transport system permease protein
LLQALPLTAVLAVFLLVPMLTLIVVSFFDYDSVQIIPGFVLTNYRDVLFSATTWWTYLETLKFTVIVWALTRGIALETPLTNCSGVARGGDDRFYRWV